ncbi:uncharacterized protein LOC135698447 [Ochlerotatus camptorhynchus]|uniref:uncharacterized protein LOC135698447 n=1 Tax=Ochlerotatus camptorhynchus TaxID=644619 RepID=UPI0031E1BC86
MTYDLSLAKLVDLAIGTPETGSIDLTVLHSLLHIIVRKLGCQTSHVDLLPEHRKNLGVFIESSEVDPSLSVTVEQRGENELFHVIPYDKNLEKKDESTGESISVDDSQDISQRLETLESRVSILPSDEELKLYQTSRESLKPNEPVDFLNLASRLDKMEISLGKLTALANDVLVEFRCLEIKVLPFLDSGDITVMQTQIHNMNHLLVEHFPGFCSRRSSTEPHRGSQRLSIDTLPMDFYTKGVPTIAALARRPPSNQRFPSQLEKEIACIKSVLNDLIELLPLPDASGSEMLLTLSELSCDESQPAMKTNFHQKAASAIINIRSVQQEIDDLFMEKEEQLNALEVSQKVVVESNRKMQETVDFIKERFDDIEIKLDQIRDSCVKNLDDYRNSLKGPLEKLTEDVKYQGNNISQRVFVLERQMDDRVDYDMFETRVSIEKFETAVATINQTLQDDDGKLAILKNQLSSWIAQLCEKVDRKELSALEIKVNKKLSLLQLHLNRFQKLDAAGTKLSGTIKCISCDNEATMKAETNAVVPIPKLFRSKTYYPNEMDGATEARKNRYCGSHLLKVGSLRTSTKTNVQRLCEARKLVNHIKKRPLDFGHNYEALEKPVYKIHK